jgi:hypothetical protein
VVSRVDDSEIQRREAAPPGFEIFGTDGFGWALPAARAIPTVRPLCIRDSSADGLGISTKGKEQSRVHAI